MILFNEESPNYNDINYDFPETTTSNPPESPTISPTAFSPITVEHPHNISKPKHPLNSKHSRMSLRFEKYKDKPTSCSEDETNYRTSKDQTKIIYKNIHIYFLS